ncbi:MAG: hypothetical protein Q7U04_07850 [Bacteriovorax sp.]|nr:hypothetical protein [Bacteriovorax sp.]
MVQDKKKGMEDANDKKGRMPGKAEEEKSSANKPGSKPSTTPNKTDSSSSRKSR